MGVARSRKPGYPSFFFSGGRPKDEVNARKHVMEFVAPGIGADEFSEAILIRFKIFLVDRLQADMDPESLKSEIDRLLDEEEEEYHSSFGGHQEEGGLEEAKWEKSFEEAMLGKMLEAFARQEEEGRSCGPGNRTTATRVPG